MLKWYRLATGLLHMALLAGRDVMPLQKGLASEGANEQCMLSILIALLTNGQRDALDPLESRNTDPSMA